jgi:predicted permease
VTSTVPEAVSRHRKLLWFAFCFLFFTTPAVIPVTFVALLATTNSEVGSWVVVVTSIGTVLGAGALMGFVLARLFSKSRRQLVCCIGACAIGFAALYGFGGGYIVKSWLDGIFSGWAAAASSH